MPIKGSRTEPGHDRGEAMQSGHHPTPEGGERTARPARPGPAEPSQTGVEHAPVGLGLANSEFELTYANRRWRDLAGFAGTLPASPETMLGLVHPDDRHRVAEAFLRCHSEGAEVRQRIRVPGSDNGSRHLMLSLCPVPDDEPGYAIGLSDVTEVVAALDEVRRSEQRFKSVTVALPIGVYRADPTGALIWSNIRLQEMGAYYGANHTGTSIYEYIHPDDVEEVQALAVDAIRRKEPFEAQHRLLGADGRVRWVISRSSPILGDDGRIIEHVGSLEDVTELHLRSVGLAHRAAHDPLTGLPNRANIEELIGALASKGHEVDDIGIVFLDLDGFKAVNDTLGHQAGDHVLIEVARRLDRNVRQGDTVGRYGGDEFVMVCPGVARRETLDAVAERARQAITSTPISDGERTHAIGVSIGTAIGPGPGSVRDLLHRADLAMYEAKRSGR